MNDCRWCGVSHPNSICPRVKAIVFAEDGITVKRVEFMTPVDYHPITGFPPINIYPVSPPIPRWMTTCGSIVDQQIQLQNAAGRPTQ